ncbi:MAG TPA: hypothetical protein DEA08_06810 [Planctomycetes bacterium]|nr:hypothetical protein [Planctomycetota bacterium]
MFRNAMSLALIFALCGAAAGQEAVPNSDEQELEDRIKKLERQLEEVTVTAQRARESLEETPILDALRSVEVYGFVDAAYSFNLRDPSGRRGRNRLRLNDPDHNSFGIPYAKLGLMRRVSGLNELDAGFRFEIGAGRLAEEAFNQSGDVLGSGSLAIPQAHIDLQIPTPFNPLLLRVGRTYGWFGIESLDLPANPNYSLSHFAQFGPKTTTGLSLGMDLGAGLRYTQYVVNGWDRVLDNNDAKTLGGQLAWELDDPLVSLALNWIYGAERDDNAGDQRWMVELAAAWQPTESLDLRAAFRYGQEEISGQHYSDPDETANFGGFLLMAKQSFFKVEGADYYRLALGVRGGLFRDEGGSRSGADQTLGELTGTLTFNLLENAAFRVEYRRDFSSRGDAFVGHRGTSSRSGQDTLSFDLSYSF